MFFFVVVYNVSVSDKCNVFTLSFLYAQLVIHRDLWFVWYFFQLIVSLINFVYLCMHSASRYKEVKHIDLLIQWCAFLIACLHVRQTRHKCFTDLYVHINKCLKPKFCWSVSKVKATEYILICLFTGTGITLLFKNTKTVFKIRGSLETTKAMNLEGDFLSILECR